jgi:hypothetical protein
MLHYRVIVVISRFINIDSYLVFKYMDSFVSMELIVQPDVQCTT